jgi:DNA repair exonuclease SbcCD ATPase subunit
MTVAGFQPIFRGDVELTARSGVSVILGGNGLGKTTLMQALIYALIDDLSGRIEFLQPNGELSLR